MSAANHVPVDVTSSENGTDPKRQDLDVGRDVGSNAMSQVRILARVAIDDPRTMGKKLPRPDPWIDTYWFLRDLAYGGPDSVVVIDTSGSLVVGIRHCDPLGNPGPRSGFVVTIDTDPEVARFCRLADELDFREFVSREVEVMSDQPWKTGAKAGIAAETWG